MSHIPQGSHCHSDLDNQGDTVSPHLHIGYTGFVSGWVDRAGFRAGDQKPSDPYIVFTMWTKYVHLVYKYMFMQRFNKRPQTSRIVHVYAVIKRFHVYAIQTSFRRVVDVF